MTNLSLKESKNSFVTTSLSSIWGGYGICSREDLVYNINSNMVVGENILLPMTSILCKINIIY